MLQTYASRMLYACYTHASRICYTYVTRMLRSCYTYASRMLYVCYTYASRILYVYYTHVMHVYASRMSLLATSELRKRPGKSEVDNASWDCFRGRKQKACPQKQSRDALSTLLLPGLLRNSEVANTYVTRMLHVCLAYVIRRMLYLYFAYKNVNEKYSSVLG